jgi:hypothetical protein
MGNFMEYLNLTPSTINQFFNTITREGKDQIYFDDVVQVIGYLEEAKLKDTIEDSEESGLSLNLHEIKIILKNFKILKEAISIKDLEELLNGIFLMFVVDFEATNGQGTAPELFNEINLEIMFNMLKKFPSQFELGLINKLEEKKLKQETGKIKINLDLKNEDEGKQFTQFNNSESSKQSNSIFSLSEALKTEKNSVLEKVSWSKNENIYKLKELKEEFNKQKSKLNILSVKGLEKTAFLNNDEKKEEKDKIKVISKVQNYMKDSILKVDKIFKESLEMLKFSQLKEEELKQKILEKEKQNQFWEKTNEEIEMKLNEMDIKNIELERELNDLKNQQSKTDRILKKREDEILQRENELQAKQDEIVNLQVNMKQSNLDLRFMEDQKSMAEKIKDFTKEELKKTEEENKINQLSAKKMISSLNQEKEKLKEELEIMRQSKRELENELDQQKKNSKTKDWCKKRNLFN